MSSSPPPATDRHTALLAVLATIRDRGPIGERSLSEAVAHSQRFVRGVPAACARLADLGSGGGLPGLVLASELPAVRVTLVERRTSRADLLRRAVAALDLGERVTIVAEDVAVLARRSPQAFDVVTARSFGQPGATARWAGALLSPGGVLLVSEPPEAVPGRWSAAVLAANGLGDEGVDDGIRRLRRLPTPNATA